LLEKEVGALKVGDRLDARDLEYVWNVSTVLLVVEVQDKPPLVCIHFEGWKNIKDEFLPVKSNRIAPLGYYTNRFEIPRNMVCGSKSESSPGVSTYQVNMFKGTEPLPLAFRLIKHEKIEKVTQASFPQESEGMQAEWLKEFL